MVRKVLISTRNGFTVRQVLRLKINSIGRQDKLRFRFGGRGTLPQRRQHLRDLSRGARTNVDVVSLENAAQVRLVRCAGSQPFDRCLLVAEGFKESIRKVLRIIRLIRQLRNGFFYFNGVQLVTPFGCARDIIH